VAGTSGPENGTETTVVATDSADDSSPDSPGASDAATIRDEALAALVDLDAGEQVQDGVGDLIAVYAVAPWPDGFTALSSDARAQFPFVDVIDPALVVDHDLYAVDIGMCAAGVNAGDGGTVDVYIHGDPDDPLATADSVNRAAFGTEPVPLPGFTFPSAGECARGWLPVYWDQPQAPGTVRYVLTAPGADGELERSVYQWSVAPTAGDGPAAGMEPFGIGQTVTFNVGPLQDSTVVVDGWSELVDTQSPIDGTRVVGVSLTVCPAGSEWPVFGLALDGWNLAMPLDPGNRLGAESVDSIAGNCFDGWLDFAAPFGTTPTGFTASDGVDFVDGFAEWSLDGAALATPR
jgi:hypothetical protein